MNQNAQASLQPVGVIGYGDLGQQLVAQLMATGHDVIVYDPFIFIDARGFSVCDGYLDVLRQCQIVHWAVPSSALSDLPDVPKACTVVLHDSVMALSHRALSSRSDRAQFGIAHCLMNEQGRVLVCNELTNAGAVSAHFKATGLSPKFITVHHHDELMARTQGVFALMLKLGIRQALDAGYVAGNLTPSAIELRQAVINREANWTKQTLNSILANPELKPFVMHMADLLPD